MFDIIKKLIFSRQITFEKGRVYLLGQSITMQPAFLFVALKKNLESGRIGNDFLYKSAKEAGIKYMEGMMNNFTMNFNESIKWGINSFELGGWGVTEIIRMKENENNAVIHIKNSTVASLYGKSKEPVDDILRGFLAGAATVMRKIDMECIETKCSSKGNSYCEFILKPTIK
jgi:predicted hydrocarbon binding protein